MKVRNGISSLQTTSEGAIKERGWICIIVRRMHEPERVFGQIKNNRGFRRFLLRGLPKVGLEVGWLSLAHQLLKKAAKDKNLKIALQG
ncbi:transposase [Paenibacillus sp. NEAU-GSW1]|uniref:transposase n=1 Tax=Paenibacillus sp. NEAU-GSW1 TaxID=2682486 RepID=UPI0020A6C518|nr:transposase [Paenibacillus sp. NEAU-GSW1]